MKEEYFNRENLHQKAHAMLREAKAIVPGQGFVFAPSQAALLVVDMQKYFLQNSSHAYIPASKAVLPRIRALIGSFYKNARPVFFTRHLNTEQNAKLMSVWWTDFLRETDPLSEITEELDSSQGIIINKCQYDAFFETPLEALLNEKQITELVVCGVMTHLCCETTVRSAFVRGFEVFFPVDGTATYNEKFHLASLRNLAHGFAMPTLAEEILSLMKASDE
jgi:isochorismate hydrolase